jgi:hypothetical protein
MFLTELTPLLKKLAQQPVAFMGGFVSGVFRLNLEEDPLKSWLTKQGINVTDSKDDDNKPNGNGPQSISIE